MTTVYPIPKPAKHKKRKPKSIARDEEYLSFIRKQPCIVCNCIHVVPHHESISGRGTGIKASDLETIPLCHFCHNERHNTGKLTFAWKYQINYTKEISRLQKIYEKNKKSL